MKSFQYDSSGSLVTSANTDSGSSSAMQAKGYSPAWTYWTNGGSAAMPTSFSNMTNPIVMWNGSAYGTMGAGILVKSPGYINALVALVNGPTGGSNVYFQVYKNNAPMAIATAGQSSTSAAFNPAAVGGPTFTFAAGDLLSVWIKGDSSSINQSFSANLEWVFTG